MITFIVNGTRRRVDVHPDTPLLWVLREQFGLTGSKYGCGEGLCGACTVHIDGVPQRSCITPVGNVQGKKVVTIEGIPENHPVKKAWLAQEVSQCGYCQPGQIMAAVAKVRQARREGREISDADLDEIRNVCRCGTYSRIREAIKAGARRM